MGTLRWCALLVALEAASCHVAGSPRGTAGATGGMRGSTGALHASSGPAEGGGKRASSADAAPGVLRIHVYDVGQGLAVLIDFPAGGHLLVDTGEAARRGACGAPCDRAHQALLGKLGRDLAGAQLDLVWITHPHSDHVGGLLDVLERFEVHAYVDNGRGGAGDEMRRTLRQGRAVARGRGATVLAVDPEHPSLEELPGAVREALRGVRVSPVLPPVWPAACARDHDENECSLVLRLDYGRSSALFVGDAGHAEEKSLAPGRATLLQVGHHGSETSSTPLFLGRVRPEVAVISVGRPDEGTNRTYCHPRAIVVKRLTRVLGGAGGGEAGAVPAFEGERCDAAHAGPDAWPMVATAAALFVTARDGDVVLRTVGDGTFVRE